MVTYSRLHRTLSRRVLNISREGDSTASLGSLFQCSVTLRGKKFFLMFNEISQLVASDGLDIGRVCWPNGLGSWGRKAGVRQLRRKNNGISIKRR